ncbi:MAG: hypothetical protein CMH77_07670 [Nitrospinae bacterium]|jgi:hypothetical protein|nr:hypothetical protein [Nitrospinota bacterium]MDP6335625.1 hypothetical protein [Nitrospinaceae bacterium]|tara:strand:- start:4843 stop:5025 length:183 start_codon:yes stop_codon:yes gene_type:complete
MESSRNGSNALGDVVYQEAWVEFEENLHKDNLRFMAEMFEGVFLEEYVRKYGDESLSFMS